MPVDRTIGEDLIRTLLDLYAEAETRLATDIARHLAAGNPDAPDWAVRKLAALRSLQRRTETLLHRLTADTRGHVEQALMLAYIRGGRAAIDELERQQLSTLERLALRNRLDIMSRLADLVLRRKTSLAKAIHDIRADLPGIEALQRLAFSLVAQVQGTHVRILRWALDSYREVVAKASVHVLLGTQTRLQVAQTAWDRLLSQGVTGFVDRSGRNWQLASYVEMATRTTTAQAAVQGHLDRLGDQGLDLVIVSNAPQECILCRPWEGKILARVGAGGSREAEITNLLTRQPMTVHVAGTVIEAVAAGLMHPNCRHSLSAYLPGATKVPTHTADPEGDKARQRQREIERTIRAWKLRQAGALTDDAKKAAGARVRAWQAILREHLAGHPELRRLPHREQIGTAR